MKVSVVIPCYNVETYIERCMRSIVGQRHQDLEIICVDDGSSDGTAEKIRSVIATSERSIQLIQQPNQGAPVARNAGAALATGTYIQFMDADDLLLPEKIQHQTELAHRTGLPGLIVGSFQLIDPDGRLVRTEVQDPADREPWLDLMQHRLSGTPQNLWKRETVAAVGGWDTALKSSQEYDLMFRMLAAGANLEYDREVLTEIHQRAHGSISQVNVDRNWIRFIELRVRIIKHLKSRQIEHDMQPYYQVLFDGIRTLYPYDRTAALELYRKHLPKEFQPAVSSATGRGYLLLHKLFRFDLANRIRMYLSTH